MDGKKLDYSSYIEIAEGVYWVGVGGERAGFHCNPYLIADRDEAVLIDGGSRSDFSTVMLKIMRTGVDPRNITRLVYQHSDPDLCGSLPHLESLIGNNDLQIISHYENNAFISYYSDKLPKRCIEDLDFRFEFSSGRRLEFVRTPYAHTAGNFITYDTKTKVLFSSDIFGGYDKEWSLYSRISERCAGCGTETVCHVTGKPCEITGILNFHRHVMPSTKALRYALDRVEELDVSLIAPQHGSIFDTSASQKAVIGHFRSMEYVGIDCYLKQDRK